MRCLPIPQSFKTELPYLLGPTNPCPIAVHTEPFSASVFKVLIWILATTTKICTRGCFIQIHIQRLLHNLHALLLFRAYHILVKVEYEWCAWAPSIFGAGSFGRWVVTPVAPQRFPKGPDYTLSVLKRTLHAHQHLVSELHAHLFVCTWLLIAQFLYSFTVTAICFYSVAGSHTRLKGVPAIWWCRRGNS
jgi:hypothetical protein